MTGSLDSYRVWRMKTLHLSQVFPPHSVLGTAVNLGLDKPIRLFYSRVVNLEEHEHD